MLPELERSGDLAEHVARRATRNLPAEMPARLRGYVQRMGEVAATMWRLAADAYGGDLPSASERLESLDDEMDDLHVTFIAELVTSGTQVVVAIELALVGRFYERLGDHAVNLARRVPSRLRPIVINTPADLASEAPSEPPEPRLRDRCATGPVSLTPWSGPACGRRWQGAHTAEPPEATPARLARPASSNHGLSAIRAGG